MKVSFSGLNTYSGQSYGCPFSFYLTRVLKLREPTGEPAAVGKACHAVIELASYEQNFTEEFFRNAAVITAGLADLKDQEDEVFDLTFKDYVIDIIQHPGAEIEKYFEIPLVEGISLRGYIDRLGQSTITDWKTNRIPYRPLENHQLGLYAWAIKEMFGTSPIKGQLVFLRSNKILTQEYGPDEIEEARQWAEGLALEIQGKLEDLKKGAAPKEAFPPQPNDKCQYCNWSTLCAGKCEEPIEEVTDFEKAQEVAQKIIQHEAVAGNLKKRLRSYVEATGPVPVGAKEFRLNASESWKWTDEAMRNLFTFIVKQGKDPFGLLSITASNLRKLSLTDDFLKEIGGTKRTYERFGLYRREA